MEWSFSFTSYWPKAIFWQILLILQTMLLMVKTKAVFSVKLKAIEVFAFYNFRAVHVFNVQDYPAFIQRNPYFKATVLYI